MHIENPILRGCFADPSIVRVGDDYYIANSTCEWFPGVPVHHSKDLVNWRLIGHILTRTSQVDLRGVADSCGVWAPSLSYADGQFWLIYTNVRTGGMGRPFKDLGVYLTTATDILGPWSEPVSMGAIGFDPSLFHDDDGRKWLVNMQWDFRRQGLARFAGIVVQEWDARSRKLVGPIFPLLEKQTLIEGPNLYKRSGWYHLMMAEGGTGWNHGIAMARSRSITGPFELDPQPSLLTTRDQVEHPLQKAGHGELVVTPNGEWFLAHLASRPIGEGENRRCMLGRETCLQRVEWNEAGWLRLSSGGWHPQLRLSAPQGHDSAPGPIPNLRDDFDVPKLGVEWSSLRVPMDESWLSLNARPGWLRLFGRESMHSPFSQSLVAKRLRSYRVVVETCLEFEPAHFTQLAGLICYYDTRTHFYLRVTHHEKLGKIVGIVLTDDGAYHQLTDDDYSVEGWPRIFLRAEIDRAELRFSFSPTGMNWERIGPILDASKLSDDYGAGLHFTGAFVGLCAQDFNATRASADFDYFLLKDI